MHSNNLLLNSKSFKRCLSLFYFLTPRKFNKFSGPRKSLIFLGSKTMNKLARQILTAEKICRALYVAAKPQIELFFNNYPNSHLKSIFQILKSSKLNLINNC